MFRTFGCPGMNFLDSVMSVGCAMLFIIKQFVDQLPKQVWFCSTVFFAEAQFATCLLSDERWQVVKGRFAAINSFLMSCRCRYSADGPAPAAHLGDGCTDLVIIHRCSRIDYTKHLYRCSDHHSDQVQQLQLVLLCYYHYYYYYYNYHFTATIHDNMC